MSDYSKTALPSALILRTFPPALRSVIGYLVKAWRIRRYHHPLLRALVPEITRLWDEQKDDKSFRDKQTFASWWIAETASRDDVVAIDPKPLAEIIMQLNFAGLHTTTLAATNVFYHILSYPRANELINDIRAEADRVLYHDNGEKTWACLERMVILDSVIRESLRLAPLDAAATNRTILEDVETPDGLTLLAGTRVCVPGYLANMDPLFYNNAHTFDPHRFLEKTTGGKVEKSWTITDNFTTFGHGLHVSKFGQITIDKKANEV